MGGRYGGSIRDKRKQAQRGREAWTPPRIKAHPKPRVDPRWVALAALAGYSIILGMLPLLL